MAEPETEEAPPKKSKLPMIIAAAVGVIVIGVGGYMAGKGGGGNHGESKSAEAKEPEGGGHESGGHESGGGGHEGGGEKKAGEVGPTVKLPDFVVRLRNPETDRYIRISFEVELAMEKDKDIVTGRMAQIRDAFISYLSDRTLEDLRGSEGLDQTKSALLKRLKEISGPSVKIRGLYITDFVSQ